MEVKRCSDVFAAWDGKGALTIGTAETLDADDCLAQIIFHEICHALTEGEASVGLPDWGLENQDDRHLVREHAAVRLQLALAGRRNLRGFFSVTTDHRRYADRLGSDPLGEEDCTDPALAIAQDAYSRFETHPWRVVVELALSATAKIVEATSPFARPDTNLHLDT
jgi:hypothetical protein